MNVQVIMDAFLPPKMNPLVLRLAKNLLPVICERHAGGIEVVISEEDLARLRTLKRQRVLLCPNHPSHFDPVVTFELSKRLDEDFYFLAAREVFNQNRGWRGWLFQHCGTYSVTRGSVDRESFAMTQKILAEGQHWLVIFIEGEASLENDAVIPFEAGVMSLALRVQDKLSDSQSGPPLYVVPVAMKSTYKPGLETALHAALCTLETSVGLPQGAGQTWENLRQRIRTVGTALLTTVEKTHLLKPRPDDSIDTRMNALKQRLLAKIETYLDLVPGPDVSFLDRVRAARNRMDRIVHTYGEQNGKLSAYEERLLALRRQTFAGFYADLGRLVNFLTLRGDYLNQASPERYAEVIIRLEQEILGRPQLLYPRRVLIRIGTVCDLRQLLPAFRKDKHASAAELSHQLEQEMKNLLQTRNAR
jgi:1-acyl-sn-glycerol-3-phosphate acyltransferase